ncbi:NADH dehydrogenase [Canna indica]|uniref:NADH dehydrogenase n=1 Tax=Canna indica TaxID=4628 RepID=A0AAQ3K1M9_9LILI|nr:NADH dehydrogenase [Canna indica]
MAMYSGNELLCFAFDSGQYNQYEALAWLCGGLSFFASLGLLAVWNDKASKIPFAPKVYPYDNLRVELGGEP